MYKKVLLLSSLFIQIGSAFANGGTIAPMPPASGFYVGAAIGGDSAHDRNNLSLNENVIFKRVPLGPPPEVAFFTNFNKSDTDRMNKNSQGWDGGLFIGYKFPVMTRLFVALEGFGDLSSNKSTWSTPFSGFFPLNDSLASRGALSPGTTQMSNPLPFPFSFNNNIHVSTRFQGDAGIRVRAGTQLNYTNAIYVFSGFSEGFFKINQQNLISGLIPSYSLNTCLFNEINLFNFSTNFQKSISRPGVQVGAGWETAALNNMGFRFQYAATFYKTFSLNDVSNTPSNIPFVLINTCGPITGNNFSFNNGNFLTKISEGTTIQQLTVGMFYNI
jgi:hypothetical protein